MPLPEIKFCPSTLQPGYTTYSSLAQGHLFGGRSKKVSHVLPFGPPDKKTALTKLYNEKRKHISISGVQEKYSIRQEKDLLRLTEREGTHILKPIPSDRLERVEDLPANEQVSMQIAKQIFGIRTAESGLIFFDDGTPAYLTRRFDIKPDGSGNYQVEDFATLLGKSPEKEGGNFKYNASYLDMANLIRQYTAAAPVVLMEFFQLMLFNYLIANGDAHLKNFSLIETTQGDPILSPAYDLVCTRLHIADHPLAMHDGLYDGDGKVDQDEQTYNDVGIYTGTSFLVFAEKAKIHQRIARLILDQIIKKAPEAITLIQQSFLSPEAKNEYIHLLNQRQQLLSR